MEPLLLSLVFMTPSLPIPHTETTVLHAAYDRIYEATGRAVMPQCTYSQENREWKCLAKDGTNGTYETVCPKLRDFSCSYPVLRP